MAFQSDTIAAKKFIEENALQESYYQYQKNNKHDALGPSQAVLFAKEHGWVNPIIVKKNVKEAEVLLGLKQDPIEELKEKANALAKQSSEFKTSIQGLDNEDELISYDDFNKKRSMIFSSVKKAVEQRFPISNDQYTLSVQDVNYKDENPYSLKEQKQAILEGKSLTKSLRGRFILTDNTTGNVIEKGSMRSLANVPYLTRRGTFIKNGAESVLINQMRMVPGAYSRETNNGLYETFVNVEHGTGNAFKMMFDPKSSEFYFKVGNRKIGAYPVMNALGVKDDDLKKAWGDDIFNKNKVGNYNKALHSAFDAFITKQNNKT